jgi:hypothetical protein
MRIIGPVGLLVMAVIAYGVIDGQPTKDIIAGVFGVIVLASLIVLMPYLGRAAEEENRLWGRLGRRIRRFANRNAKPY